MPRYRVTNRATRGALEVEAPYAQEACEALGLMIGDCYVRLLREGPYPSGRSPSGEASDIARATRDQREAR